MKKINCLVVDDEPIARDIICSYIERLEELCVLLTCRNATETSHALRTLPVDVMFLDIQMPGVTGTELLRSLQRPPLVVFTTAHPGYALEGYDLNCVDYLLKPITFERFYQAIQKLQERLAALPKNNHEEKSPEHLFIRQDTKLVKLPFAQISYIQAERDFCSIYLDDGKRLLAGMHLKALEEVLPGDHFIRVHRSYIVNLDKIQVIKGNIILLHTQEIPIGANYRDDLFRRIRQV